MIGVWILVLLTFASLKIGCGLGVPAQGAYCVDVGVDRATLQTQPGYWRTSNTSMEWVKCM